MDSRTALERLDAVRPGSDDLSLPEMAGVAEILESDSELFAEHRRRQSWDRSIAVSMLDVPVPVGLKERLLKTLATQSTVVEDVSVRPAKQSRRSALRLMSGAAAGIVAAGVFWLLFANSSDPLTVAQAEAAAAELASGSSQAETFRGGFTPEFPTGNWNRLQTRPGVVGLLNHRAAAWQFSFGRMRGVLVAIPVKDVETPPATKREYVGGSSVAWTEGNFVYVCRVEGPIDELLRQIDDARFA